MADEQDPRFAHVAKDPRFRQMGKKARKVHIDKRFRSMFKDKRFKLKYTVDKRGRPLNTSTNEDLRKFYDLSDSDESDDSEEEEEEAQKISKSRKKNDKKRSNLKKRAGHKLDDSSSGIGEEFVDSNPKSKRQDDNSGERQVESSDADDQSSNEEESEVDVKDVDLARGEGNQLSSSDEEEEFAFEQEKFDHNWAELDKEAPVAPEITSRLAVCNMDWDRIKAEDLLVLFNSFKPTDGTIKQISIYLSEFGKQRLAEEDLKGPKELVEHKEDEETGSKSDGSAYHTEKLRQYQLNRLKYYYAVMECDSPETANHIYEKCDGTEYESSSTKIDLRFIPDDMEFDEAPASSVSDMPDTTSYKPSLFNCKALNQSRVELTWDETDRRRQVLLQKFSKDDLEKMDIKDFLAGSSSEDEEPYAGIEVADFLKEAAEKEDAEDEEKKKQKYKDILSIAKEKRETFEDSDMEMEITWEPGLKEATEDLVDKKTKKKNKLSPWEKYLEKSKTKKSKKQTKLKNDDSGVSPEQGSEDDIPEGVDMNDPYFKEEIEKFDEGSSEKSPRKKKKQKKQTAETVTESGQNEQAALSLLMMDEDNDSQHFSLKSIQQREKLEKKRRKKKTKQQLIADKAVEDTFKMDLDDPRFASVYDNPHFNIDPSAPEYKATKSMDLLVREKINRRDKKRKRKTVHNSEQRVKVTKVISDFEPSQGDSVANLVNSVKAKAKKLQTRKAKCK